MNIQKVKENDHILYNHFQKCTIRIQKSIQMKTLYKKLIGVLK